MAAPAGVVPVENWGLLRADESGVSFHAVPKGRGSVATPATATPRFNIPLTAIASASGTTKNDVSIQLQSGTAAGASSVGLELLSIRFAVPSTCVGFEQTEEAGKELLQQIQGRLRQSGGGMSGSALLRGLGSDERQAAFVRQRGGAEGTAAKEVKLAVFEDVPVSYPSGKFTITLTNFAVSFSDSRKQGTAFAIPLWNISQLFLCDIPTTFSKNSGHGEAGADDGSEDLAQYVVVILKTPVQVRTTTYAHVVISCPAGASISAEFPWKCEISSQPEINAALGISSAAPGSGKEATEDGAETALLTPTMHGKVSEVLVRVFKAVASLQPDSSLPGSPAVQALGGKNSKYRSMLTGQQHSVIRCLHKGSEGLLYVVNSGLLFLHRPATRILFTDVDGVEVDEANSGVSTFQLEVFVIRAAGPTARGAGAEKVLFSSVDKAEKDNLLKYLETRVKVVRHGMEADGDDDEGDSDDDDDDQGEVASDDSDTGDDEDEESDFDFDESNDGSDDGEVSNSDEDERNAKRKKQRVEDGAKGTKSGKKDKKSKKDKKDKKSKKDKKDKLAKE